MKRLVCIVEGQGEVAAIPNLCARVMRHLGIEGWHVDGEPIRQPRSALVDAKVAGPRRPCREESVRKALALARRRSPDAVLMLCDEDDDCAAVWGPDATQVMRRMGAGVAVMAVREYETWLLLARTDEALANAGISQPARLRDAKKALAQLVPGYLPTTHQLLETRSIDVAFLRGRSHSFDKFVRSIALLCGVEAPAARP